MRGLARIYDVRIWQFVLKIEKLSRIMGPRGSQDLRSPSLTMAPGVNLIRVPKGGSLEPWSPEISVVEPGARSFY